MQPPPEASEEPSLTSPYVAMNIDLFDNGNERKTVVRERRDGDEDESVAPSAPLMPSPSPVVPVYYRIMPILFSIVFAVLLFSRCANHLAASGVEKGSSPRQLAEGHSSSSEEDADVAAIVNLCLELEQSSPDLLQHPRAQEPVQYPQAASQEDKALAARLWHQSNEFLPQLLTSQQAQLDQSISTATSTQGAYVAPFTTPFNYPVQQAPPESLAGGQSLQFSYAGAEEVLQQPFHHSSSYYSAEGWWVSPPPHPTRTMGPPFSNQDLQQMQLKSGPEVVTQGLLPSGLLQGEGVRAELGGANLSPPFSKRLPIPSRAGSVEVGRHFNKSEGIGQGITGGLSPFNPDTWIYPTATESPLPRRVLDELDFCGGDDGQGKLSNSAGYTPQTQQGPSAQLEGGDLGGLLPTSDTFPEGASSDLRRPCGAAAYGFEAYKSAAFAVAGKQEGPKAFPTVERATVAYVDPLSMHPFYRLPMLEPGVRTPPFVLVTPKNRNFTRTTRVAFDCLRDLRELFLKQSLNQSEAEAVLASAFRLSEFLQRWHTSPVKALCTTELAYHLGRRYLMLDGIISAIYVLGASRESVEAFKQLAVQIPIDMAPTDKEIGPPKVMGITKIIDRLRAALIKLKDGVRPSAKETVRVKRDLFRRLKHRDFKRERYDRWRRDDDLFKRGETE